MAADEHTLEIARVLKAPLHAIWRCWTEPPLLMQWFCPRPWRVSAAEIELKTGGRFFTRMEGPEGQSHDLNGVLLLVEPERRLIFTDAFGEAWVPSARAFMVGDVTFAAAGPQTTHYTARALHWSAEAKAEHEAMGFHTGWNAAADQLEDVAQGL